MADPKYSASTAQGRKFCATMFPRASVNTTTNSACMALTWMNTKLRNRYICSRSNAPNVQARCASSGGNAAMRIADRRRPTPSAPPIRPAPPRAKTASEVMTGTVSSQITGGSGFSGDSGRLDRMGFPWVAKALVNR